MSSFRGLRRRARIALRATLRDVVKPSSEAGFGTVTLAVTVDAQEDVLGHILRFLTIAELSQETAEDTRPITVDQAGERSLIVRLDAQHQVDIVFGGLRPG